MSIYKPSLLDKFKDFVNGLKSNWDEYEAHVADFESHLAESASKHITESGENENGSYVRFDDGTQICRISRKDLQTGSVNTNVLQGLTIYRVTSHPRWVFPASFKDTSYIINSMYTNPTDSPIGHRTWITRSYVKTNSYAYVQPMTLEEIDGNSECIFDLIAIGRWK